MACSDRRRDADTGFKLGLAIAHRHASRRSRSFRSGCWSTTARARPKRRGPRSPPAGADRRRSPARARHPLSRDRDRDRGRERPERHPQPRRDARADAGARSASIDTDITPELRKRSIYEAVVYDRRSRAGALRLAAGPRPRRDRARRARPRPRRASLRRSATRAASAPIRGSSSTASRLRLQPGGGSSGRRAASSPWSMPRACQPADRGRLRLALRGNEALSLVPQAGDTRWTVRSTWPHPSFGGAFLPAQRQVGADGFSATYRIGNLALGRSLVDPRRRRNQHRRRANRTAAPRADAAERAGGAFDPRRRAGQPDPAGRSLFAGRPRDEIRLPVHRLHLPRPADVRRHRRGARVARSNIC